MNCPNCQTNLPEGAISCPNCATPVPYPNAFSNPIPTDGMQKKPKKGLIIGISFGAVIMIAALITCILFFIIGQKDGTYVCEDLSAYGVDVTLKVNGNKCELKVSG
ncbi:MAG: hypothetical protein K2N34_04625 [Lachnospiraceae bacterium]|nr:hypothetical protein [Lachnospiraceae bacterium]